MMLEGALVFALSIASTGAVGLELGGAPRRRVATSYATAARVLLASVVLLPLTAWIVTLAVDLGGSSAGVLLAASFPGGSTGPLLASAAGGDVRVASRWFVVLMALGTVVALVATALLAPGGVGRVLGAAALVFAVSALPLLLGRELAARGWLSARAAKAASRASLGLLIATVVVLLVNHLAEADVRSLAASALIAVVGAGAATALLVRVPAAMRTAIVQVGTVRNLTLALVVMEVVGAAPSSRVAALGYGLVMYVVAGGIAGWTRYAARP